MKRYVLLAIVFFTLPRVATAGEKLLLYSDATMTSSSISDDTPRIANFYVVNTDMTGQVGLRFSVKPGPGFTGVWLSDNSSYSTVGNTPTDISVGYGLCLPGPVLVVTVSYQLFGTSSPCSELRVAPADGFPVVVAASSGCFFIEVPILEIGRIDVNCPLATEATTWGKVKSLYRQ